METVSLKTRHFLPIFLASILLSVHYSSTLYINSSFLGKFFSSSGVSFIFLAGALVAIFFFTKVPILIEHFGKRVLFLLFLAAEAVATLGLALSASALSAGIWFVVYSGTLAIVFYLLDIFLEDVSTDKKTGRIRGLYLTLMNAAIVLGPLLAAEFATENNFSKVYFLAFALLLPIFITPFFLSSSALARQHERFSHLLSLRQWLKNHNVRRVTLARLVLNLFYTLMIIFTPLYLREIIGFDWQEIGLMFSIMLLPFVLFEWPIGILQDRAWGEKEIMTLGFFISGTALLVMPFLGKSFLIWTIMLFISRIGASWIEISTESYFFKKVTSQDAGLISLFRMTGSVSTVIGAIAGGVMVSFLPFSYLFFVVAVVVLFGMNESLFIKDTL